jgi:dTDP-4-dehydrorhamnose reductase
MRILVTGSEGQLGRELMGCIEAQAHHEALGLDLPLHDLTDRDVTLGAITGWEPDLVIHTAAMTAVDRCETEPEAAHVANCLATRFVADGARRVGAHVVYLSTDYVFDGSKVGPYVEWDRPDPRSVYGATKLGGEREIDPGWTVARTSWVCSAHGSNMVRTLLRLAEERESVSFVDDQVGHPTFAGDLARMVLKLGVERVPGTFHTTNSGEVSWYGFAREVFAAAGHDPDRVEPISTAELDPPRPAPRPANSVLDNLAWRGHGFAPSRDFREPLAEVVGALTGSG